jgi:hypothetical protein
MNANTRAWLYRIALSVVPLLVLLGFLTEELAAATLNIVAALLAVGSSAVALRNVTPDDELWVFEFSDEEDDED